MPLFCVSMVVLIEGLASCVCLLQLSLSLLSSSVTPILPVSSLFHSSISFSEAFVVYHSVYQFTSFQIKLCSISGYSKLKAKLHEAVRLTLHHGSVFKRCGFSAPSRFLLFGPPGCGKSTLISALAAEFHLNAIPVKRSTVLGKYFGESEQNLAKIFQQVIHIEPSDCGINDM